MNPELEQLIVDETQCPYCFSGRGRWCRTASNIMAANLHSSRCWALQQAYGIGYIEAEQDCR